MKSILKTFFAIFIALTVVSSAYAQKLAVESMTMEPMDLSASKYSRTDLNGKACALVKVQIPLEGMVFEGNVMGDVENKAGEYWVYLTAGTKFFKIKHRSVTPLFLTFADYGLEPLSARTTYVLRLAAPASAASAQHTKEVIFKLVPAEAILIVDDVEREVVNGTAKIQLTQGSHRCSVSYPGYKAISDEFVVKDGMPKRVYELESKTGASQTVSTPTPTPTPASAATPTPVEKPFETFTVNGVTFEMVRVEGGSFMMGSNDPEAYDDEKPVHSESVATFHIGRTEVTQDLWQAVMGTNPSYFHGGNLPVEKVSWDDCRTFCDRLSQLTGRQFRLPTEAEWEYAARGGNRSRGYKYSGSNNLDNVGWYDGNSGRKTHPVGTKQANELGLYDMSGNVWEWTSDLWSSNYGSPRNGSSRVSRGGSWGGVARGCRSAYRSSSPANRNNNLGLRLAL